MTARLPVAALLAFSAMSVASLWYVDSECRIQARV